MRSTSHRIRRLGCGLAMWFSGASVLAGATDETPVVSKPDSAPPAASESTPAKLELVQQRYPNGAVMIERHVMRDTRGSYIQHGLWSMFDEHGEFLGGGEYKNNVREEAWVRHFRRGEAEILAGAWTAEFEAPFTSRATFQSGQLHGAWTITDAKNREVLSWDFDRGIRHGKSVWRLASGQVWREVNFTSGQPDGALREWNAAGKLVVEEKYVDGRQLAIRVEKYPSGAKRAEAQFMLAQDVTETTENWWQGVSRTQAVGQRGRDLRHGPVVMYYENGQPALQGEYLNDQPHGLFVWQYKNGLRAIEGRYAAGKQDGTWTWWHDNGEIRIQGHYASGDQNGQWSWHSPNGLLLSSVAYSVNGVVAGGTAPLEQLPAPPALKDPEQDASEAKAYTAQEPTLAPAKGTLLR